MADLARTTVTFYPTGGRRNVLHGAEAGPPFNRSRLGNCGTPEQDTRIKRAYEYCKGPGHRYSPVERHCGDKSSVSYSWSFGCAFSQFRKRAEAPTALTFHHGNLSACN